VHTALGAFVAGILIGQSPILTEHIEEQLRGFIVAFFSPVFFAVAGLGMDLRTLMDPTLLLFTGLVIAAASVGKFTGAMLGGKVGGLTLRESLALATGLNARGSTEVIIASIGLSMGALGKELYTMIVAMAVVTTMAMPPMLRWMMARVPLGEDEARRLEQEEAEQTQALPKMERALVYVDDSANGRLAARLAGLFAARRQMLTTVLEVGHDTGSAKAGSAKAGSEHQPHGERVAEAARATAEPKAQSDALVTARAGSREDALGKELARGYDIAFIGLADPIDPVTRRFSPRLSALVDGFSGSVALALNGDGAAGPADVPLDILLPTRGTQDSQLAAEVAMALAGGSKGAVTALHVFHPNDDNSLLRGRARRPGISLLVHTHRLGKRSGVPVKGRTATNSRPEAVIGRALRGGRFDLVVLGTALRQGEGKFLGPRTASVLAAIRTPALLIAR
jgi:nucleotide-binding universal stress UspA family protein